MNCQQCKAPMQLVAKADGLVHRWCASCGSLMTAFGDAPSAFSPPKIVSRVLAVLGFVDRFDGSPPCTPDVRALREAATGRPES